MGSTWLGVEDKFFRFLEFYNYCLLGKLIKALQVQSFHHRVVNLWKICIINRVWNMFLFQPYGPVWSFPGSLGQFIVERWARKHLSEQLSGLSGDRSAFAWLFITHVALWNEQPCSGAEMCWAKSLPWTACGPHHQAVSFLVLKKQTLKTCAIGQGKQSGWGVPTWAWTWCQYENVHGRHFKNNCHCSVFPTLCCSLSVSLDSVHYSDHQMQTPMFLWYHCDRRKANAHFLFLYH